MIYLLGFAVWLALIFPCACWLGRVMAAKDHSPSPELIGRRSGYPPSPSHQTEPADEPPSLSSAVNETFTAATRSQGTARCL
jgi:hypothetical protein